MTKRLRKLAQSRGACRVDRFDQGVSTWSWRVEPIDVVRGARAQAASVARGVGSRSRSARSRVHGRTRPPIRPTRARERGNWPGARGRESAGTLCLGGGRLARSITLDDILVSQF
jgi:hypothetical protein